MLNRKNYITAIVMMAAIVVATLIGGCATTRHVHEIRADIARLEAQNQETQALVARMESAVASGTSGDGQLRADMATTMQRLDDQISSLLENYNDLMQIMNEIRVKPEVHVLRPSPGASDQGTTTQGPGTASAEPTIDCTSTYDEAFILVRRGEYNPAIEGFRTFLQQCPEHDYAENAYYWIGECHYSLEKYADAVTDLEYLIEEYKSSPNVGRALYKLARSKQELEKTDEAIALYQRLIDDHPGSLEAEQAKERLKEIK